MSEYVFISGGICAPAGFKAAGIHCGVRKSKDKKDLALIVSGTLCASAAVYTRNKVFGAPVTVTREHLKNGHAQAVICNAATRTPAARTGSKRLTPWQRWRRTRWALPKRTSSLPPPRDRTTRPTRS